MRVLKRSVMILSFAVASIGLFAQTVDEAGTKYNDGVEQMKAKDYSAAVTSFEEALKMATAVGLDADDLKVSIEKQLGSAYYKNGIALYKAKNLDGSLAVLNDGYGFAKEISDSKLEKKFVSVIAQVYSKKGDALRKKGQLDEAFAQYELGLEIKPTCVKAFYGEGLVYKEKGDMDMMMEKMNLVIQNGEGDSKAAKTVAKAKKTASTTLVNEAARELQKEHGSIAVKYINDSFKYADGNADTYYYLTIAYNKSNQFSKAAEAGNKAVGMQEGDKSDIYFELGQALEGKGDATAACNAYKKVTSGPNVDAAKYQMKEKLKCS